MPRNLFLLSNSTLHGSDYLQYPADYINKFLNRFKVSSVLFIPYALRDHDQYEKKVKGAFARLGYTLKSVHHNEDPSKEVERAEAIYVGGGNTFQLLKTLYDKNLIGTIRRRVLEDGIPYIGASAGSNVATISICTTNDMPIVYPPTFDALGLVPFNINPHYIDPDVNSKHMGETRETRLKQYHEIPGMPPVVALREGSMLEINNDKIILRGTPSARIFMPNEEAKEYESGADLSFLLQ